MIVGAHSILYTTDAEADRAFLRDVLGFPSVDVGHGWLIFGLPPSELACHPAERNGRQELYLMVDDVDAFVARMAEHQVPCTSIAEEPWGRLVQITLPSGSELGVYQARHPRPEFPTTA